MNYLLFLQGAQGLQTLNRLLGHTNQIAVVVPDGWDNDEIEAVCRDSRLDLLVRTKAAALDLSDRKVDVIVSSQFQFRIHPSEYEHAPNAVNIHASILPTYRGRHSDVWALINDEKILGVTVHRLNERFDDGEILHIETVGIDDTMSNAEIYARVAATIPDLVDRIADGTIFLNNDTHEGPDIYWRARKADDSQINWHLTARKQFCFVRALARPPIYAYSRYRGARYEIREVAVADSVADAIPGTIIERNGALHAVCGDGQLVRIIRVDTEGPELAPGMVLH